MDLLIPTNPIPTRYSNTKGEANSVIDLIFLCSGSNELNNYSIHPNWYLSSDHTPLTISIPITEENIILFRLLIPKNSKEKAAFVKEATIIIKSLNISNLTYCDKLEDIVNIFESKIKQACTKNTKQMRITKHSKQWWNEECGQVLDKYRMTESFEFWKTFKKVVKITKRFFFNDKIQEIANKS